MVGEIQTPVVERGAGPAAREVDQVEGALRQMRQERGPDRGGQVGAMEQHRGRARSDPQDPGRQLRVLEDERLRDGLDPVVREGFGLGCQQA